ncbi:MAG: polysaccharide deacetylase family protein [Kiritimatiellia bacterium]
MTRNAYIIDIESFVFPDNPQFQDLSSDERKRLDDGYILTSTNKILDYLRETGLKLTFAVVAELYEWYPELIDKIAEDGHEIGYHGHTHRIIRSADVLASELERSEAFIERYKPAFYQAPAIYFVREGYQLLRQAGFKYSNNVYTGEPCMVDGILEIPVTTTGAAPQERVYPHHMTVGSLLKTCPFGSELFTAVLSTGRLLKLYNAFNAEGRNTVSFIHDWQFVTDRRRKYPRLSDVLKQPLYLPYTWNLWNKFRRLTSDLEFCRISCIFDDYVVASGMNDGTAEEGRDD